MTGQAPIGVVAAGLTGVVSHETAPGWPVQTDVAQDAAGVDGWRHFLMVGMLLSFVGRVEIAAR